MADKDEEYHFAEPETPSPYSTEPDQPRKDRDFQGRKKSRNVILFIAVLMALWSIYKFIEIFLAPPKKPPSPSTAVTPPAPTVTPPAPPKPTKPPVVAPLAPTVVPPVTPKSAKPLIAAPPAPTVTPPAAPQPTKLLTVAPPPPPSGVPQPTKPLAAVTAPTAAPPVNPQLTEPQPMQVQATLPNQQLQDIADQKARLNKLESNMVNLQTTLSDINTKLNDLANQVDTLTSQTSKPPLPLVPNVKKPCRPKKRMFVGHHTSVEHCCSPGCPSDCISTRPSRRHPIHVSYSYGLEAAIPGRAWLIRSDGETLTVSVGDKIPGYGTVICIDPNEGVVQISSGATIKYRSH